jgi:hypothetical protein
MSHDAETNRKRGPVPTVDLAMSSTHDAPRMQYRNRPVSVAVDPISLVISECISITSAIQKHARSQHSSVSAILGGSPNPVHLAPPSPSMRIRNKNSNAGTPTSEVGQEILVSNRWGLRGQKGKSMQDNPLIAGFGKLRHEIAGIKGAWLAICEISTRIDLNMLDCRRTFLRCAVAPGAVPAHYPSQRHGSANYHPSSGSFAQVSRIWIHLPWLSSVRLRHAKSFRCGDTLSV